MTADDAAGIIDGDASPSSSSRSTGSTSSRTPTADKTTVPAGRMGFGEAFRASIRPIHVGPDLAALPWIAVHTKALWVPVLITVASTIAVIGTQGGTISQFMFAYFIQTPAIGGVFIAGFLAPRASWLLGVIVGLVAALCYSILVLGFPSTIYPAAPPAPDTARDVALSAFVLSPVIGGFFAAGAAWYRRFLAYSSPNRGRSSQGQKSTARPGDGRTRTGTSSQKAGAKR
ncbi:MAG TPA: hypothetical protein VGQ31_02885 [Candidatus Limnocylindrales bacterium]|jgi:hypothetical protein|nr:hypothetical protein [Candidatus Limnocylindrales bacterium]